jgi:hypothetical protein
MLKPVKPRLKYDVFISYRHADSDAVARILHFFQLVFGKGRVFHDRMIPPGDDFRDTLISAINDSVIVVAIIGPTWIESFNPNLQRVKEKAVDWVQVELDHAFSCKPTKLVVPVLLHPAALPAFEQLPGSPIAELAFRQARVVWPGLGFENSVHQLADELLRMIDPTRADRITTFPRRSWLTVVISSLTSFALLSLLLWNIFVVVQANPKFAEAEIERIERRVETIRRSSSTPDRDRMSGSVTVASLGSPDHSLIDVLSDERIWDLRGVKQLGDKDPPFSSFAVLRRHVRLVKLGDVKEFRIEGRTSGSDVFLRCESPGFSAKEYVSQSPAATSKRIMQVRQLGIDIGHVRIGEEFQLDIRITYWDSFQTKDDCWVGAIGYPKADLISFLVIMPVDRPWKSYQLRSQPLSGDEEKAFAGPSKVFFSTDQTAFCWEIPVPRSQEVFTVRWTW